MSINLFNNKGFEGSRIRGFAAMIAFDLKCSKGHTFEGWFEDGKAYEVQNKKGLVSCPICDDKTIIKAPSVFAIKGSQVKRKISDNQKALMELTWQVSEYVEKNFDNVGCNFAKEALKIHYGVSEPRNIRGTSTKQEEKTLKDEGIEFFKIPLQLNQDPEPDSD